MKRVTIKDLAKMLNLSASTVSSAQRNVARHISQATKDTKAYLPTKLIKQGAE